MGGETVRENVESWLEETAEHDMPGPREEWTLEHWSFIASEYPDLRYWVAHQPGAPEAVIRLLAASDDLRVRGRVAEKRNLPRDLFPVMAADPDPSIRRAIACNQKSPIELVERLAQDTHEMVARVAAYNLRERLAKLAKKQQ